MGGIPTSVKLFVGCAMVVAFMAVGISEPYFSKPMTTAQWAGWLGNLIIGCTALISAQLDKMS